MNVPMNVLTYIALPNINTFTTKGDMFFGTEGKSVVNHIGLLTVDRLGTVG